MAHALPLTKLAGLLVKTLAKPLSKQIKHRFSRVPVGQRLLIGIGQTSHQVTSRLTIWSAGYRVRSITALEEDKALQLGSEFVGETVVFLISGGVLVWEYNRSSQQSKAKEAQAKAVIEAERHAMQAKLHSLDVRLKALEEVVKSNSQSILNLGGRRYKPPNDNEIVPIDDNTTTDPNRDGKNSGAGIDAGEGDSSSISWWRRLSPW